MVPRFDDPRFELRYRVRVRVRVRASGSSCGTAGTALWLDPNPNPNPNPNPTHRHLRYRGHRGKGLDTVQLWFASMASLYVGVLWIYHAVDPHVEAGHRFDRQVLTLTLTLT